MPAAAVAAPSFRIWTPVAPPGGIPLSGLRSLHGTSLFRCTGCGLELEVSPLEFFHGPTTVDGRPRRLRPRKKKPGMWLFLGLFGLMGTVLVQIILSW